jgi:hypothetical protein
MEWESGAFEYSDRLAQKKGHMGGGRARETLQYALFRIRICMDPHQSEGLDLDPHQSPDPDPHQFEDDCSARDWE